MSLGEKSAGASGYLSRLLALDTSTADLTVALLDGTRVLGHAHRHSERNHSIQLVPVIQELLKQCGTQMKELDGIAVGQGPGSYTGIRIGVTVAKTLAWSLNLPLLGVSSLSALAFGARAMESGETAMVSGESDDQAAEERLEEPAEKAGPRWIVPLLDARRGHAYTALYEQAGTAWHCLERDGKKLVEVWLNRIAEQAAAHPRAEELSILFVGQAESRFAELIRQNRELAARDVTIRDTTMHAANIGLLAQRQYRNSGQSADIHSFAPNYTQLPEAEVKRLTTGLDTDMH